MQAIILAAGIGKRLKPLTEKCPKCMVEVKGKPIIINMLDELVCSKKIKEVLIVCGYMADKIQELIGNDYRGLKIDYIINPKYESTNNVYSLYLAKDWVDSDCILLESDLYYKSDLMNAILSEEHDCSILVSPFNEKTMNGTIIVADNMRAKALVVKAHQDSAVDYSRAYKTVNVYKFGKAFWTEKFMPALDLYIKTGNLNSYYELVLGSLIYYQNDDIAIKMIGEDRWYEIDDIHDLDIVNKCEL